jgi:hypothetical protein
MIDKMEDRVKHAFNKYEDVLIMWLKNVNDGHVILGILFKRWQRCCGAYRERQLWIENGSFIV